MILHKEVKSSILSSRYLIKKGFSKIVKKDNLLVLTGTTIPIYFNLDSRRIEIYTTKAKSIKTSITIMELSTIEYIIRRIIKKYYSFL